MALALVGLAGQSFAVSAPQAQSAHQASIVKMPPDCMAIMQHQPAAPGHKDASNKCFGSACCAAAAALLGHPLLLEVAVSNHMAIGLALADVLVGQSLAPVKQPPKA